jgi:multidrug efflux pump subunit AcrA (membrane-fusion protein)
MRNLYKKFITNNPINIAMLAIALVVLFLVLIKLVLFATHKNNVNIDIITRPNVSKDGSVIVFPVNSKGLSLIKTEAVYSGKSKVKIMTPAKVVISAVQDNILFNSQDAASIYSYYKQNSASYTRAKSNYERVKDMYKSGLATVKDINDAESDFLSNQALFKEYEVKLRSEGFRPEDFKNIKSNSAWIVADIAESQIREVQIDETVDIYLFSFADKKFTGRVIAIGDIIDQTTRTIKVRILVDNSEKLIKPGMFGKVDFGYSQSSISLPTSAVVTVEDQSYVFVTKAKNEFHRVSVSVLRNDSNNVIILYGVNDGDKVATEGSILLKGLSFGY